MNPNKETSFKETFNLFNSESERLKTTINTALEKSNILSIHEIVDVYYQTINVNSLLKFVKIRLSNLENVEKYSKEHKILLERIQQVENLIAEKFDANLHPLVMIQLTNSIDEQVSNLKSKKREPHNKKSKHAIEQEAMKYEKLREMMSTKEFVDQYNKGLEHD